MSYGRRKTKSRIIGADIFKEVEDIVRPVENVGAYESSDGRVSSETGTYSQPLNESQDQQNRAKEEESYQAKKKEATELILGIQDKLNEINRILSEQTVGFYIRFDPSLYPDVSDATRFYSNGKYDNYIDQIVYDAARGDKRAVIQHQYDIINQSITNTETNTNGDVTVSNYGASGVSRSIQKQKKINVISLAFKQLLQLILDWFYGTPVIKAALSFFFKKRQTANEVLGQLGITGDIQFVDNQWRDVTSRNQISDDNILIDDRIVTHSDILLKYVNDVVLGDETYVEANIPNPTAYIISDILIPLQTQFIDTVELTNGFLDDEGVRAIGRTSMLHVPLSPTNTPSSRYISSNLKPIFPEEFLKGLDSNLERILRILQGWYLDPRTYCCLINALGGISSLVPKWLYTLRFGLKMASAGVALDIASLQEKIINLLNLIVQGILGGIVNQLYYFLNGFASQKEHELMNSILKEQSELIKCLPFDILIGEFRIAFNDMLFSLKSKVDELLGHLMISHNQYDRVITLLERKTRLDRLLNLLDTFISTWELGYICSENERVFEMNDPIFNIGDLPPDVVLDLRTRASILGTLDQLPDDVKKDLKITGNVMRPPVSVDEISDFLSNRLKLDSGTVKGVQEIYASEDDLRNCLSGLSAGTLQSYKSQIDRILSN